MGVLALEPRGCFMVIACVTMYCDETNQTAVNRVQLARYGDKAIQQS